MQDNDFGKKIVLIAKEKFGSQKNMSNAIGITNSTVSKWISGKIYPSFEVLRELCLKAEISLDWLVLGKTFESDVIDVTLFNEVFNIAFQLAQEEELPINGSYFLGVYDMVKEHLKTNPKLSAKEIVENNRKMIVRLRNN